MSLLYGESTFLKGSVYFLLHHTKGMQFLLCPFIALLKSIINSSWCGSTPMMYTLRLDPKVFTSLLIYFCFCLFVCFPGGSRDWTQGVVHARQGLCHWATCHPPFSFILRVNLAEFPKLILNFRFSCVSLSNSHCWSFCNTVIFSFWGLQSDDF